MPKEFEIEGRRGHVTGRSQNYMIVAFGCNDQQSFHDMHVFNMESHINVRVWLNHFQHRITDGGVIMNLERCEGRMLLVGGNHQNESELVLYEMDINGNYTKRES